MIAILIRAVDFTKVSLGSNFVECQLRLSAVNRRNPCKETGKNGITTIHVGDLQFTRPLIGLDLVCSGRKHVVSQMKLEGDVERIFLRPP